MKDNKVEKVQVTSKELQVLVNRKVACVVNYITEINSKTDRCGFANIAGHVSWLVVRVAESKISYEKIILGFDHIRILPPDEYGEMEKCLMLTECLSKLDNVISKLEEFIPEGSYDSQG